MVFNEQLPEWHATGVEPPESKKNQGWQPDDKPPADWFNWLFNRIYKVLVEIRNTLSGHVEDPAPHSGHETPDGATQKANAALTEAKGYTDGHAEKKDTHGAGSGYYLAKTSRQDQLPAWEDVQGKPSSYQPSAHQHTKSDISDFPISMTPSAHKTTHASGGSDALTPADIGAETPAGAQAKATAAASAALAAANDYTDQEVGEVAGDLASHLADTVQDEGGVHGLEIEEGLWTPAIVGATVAGNHTYTQQVGYYYKTGKKVYINGKVRILTKDIEMSGYVLIGGLPFVPSKFSGGTIAEIGNINLGTHQQFALYVGELTILYLVKISTNSGANNVMATDIADDSYVYFTAEYLTN